MKPSESLVVDTHCHIDLFPSPETVVRRSLDAQVGVIAVTNAPSVFHYTYSLSNRYSNLLPAIGLHPELAVNRKRELPQMWLLLEKTRYVGEIGLDYVTSLESERRVQREVFHKILERCAAAPSPKILTIHSRRATLDVIEAIGHGFPGRIILHWFSGTKKELERAVGLGFYFSVNSAMLGSAKGRNLVSRIPQDRILIETDGPFVSNRGKPSEPVTAIDILESLATLWRVDINKTAFQISSNFVRLTSL